LLHLYMWEHVHTHITQVYKAGKTIFSIEIKDLFCPSFPNPAFFRFWITINLSPFVPQHTTSEILFKQTYTYTHNNVSSIKEFSLRIRKCKRCMFEDCEREKEREREWEKFFFTYRVSIAYGGERVK
jgi:hypothetical protein